MGLLVAIVVLLGWSQVMQLSGHLNSFSDNTFPSVIGLWKINEGQTQIESSERALLTFNLSAEEIRAEERRIQNAWKQIDSGFKQYEGTPRTPEEERAYQQLQTTWATWKRDHEAFLQLYQTFKRYNVPNPYLAQAQGGDGGRSADVRAAIEVAASLKQQMKNNNVSFQTATDAVLEVLRINEENANNAAKQAKAGVGFATFWSILALLAGPGIAISLGLFLSQTIASPLGKKIQRVVNLAEMISGGDLTASVEVTEQDTEIGRLQAAFRAMTQRLNLLISKVQQSGIQITSSTTQIAASGKELEATMNEQVASNREVVATARQIAITSRELANTMQDVTNVAEETAHRTSLGQESLNRMENTMGHMSEATRSISSRLGIISEKANNINHIVTTITKVADQTNLLSLNAAIEAEKAGEYGLGFAVVAREIRRLADQTAIATLDIEQTVKEVQAAVSSGVMEMDKFTQEVNRGVEDIHTISIQFKEIIEQVQNLAPRFESVNHGMEAQSEGAQQISETVAQLSEASAQTAETLTEINRAIEHLNEVAQTLRQEILSFKLASGGGLSNSLHRDAYQGGGGLMFAPAGA